MREIDLTEYRQSGAHTLSVPERDALSSALPSLAIAPVSGTADSYHLTPGSTVGAIEIGDLSVRIEPKIGITQLLSLACYAIGKVKFQASDFNFPVEYALPDVLALALARAARGAFSRGLLHGYFAREETLHTVRGRIRFDDQIRRRFSIPLPIEVRYDDFTDDILANRLVKAAARRLGRMPLRSPDARRNLGWITGMLDNVSLLDFPRNDVPKVPFDRLNEHYRNVVELSRLVLQQNAFESRRGDVRASGFLMDMNAVFQEFLTVALREALGLSERCVRRAQPSIRSMRTAGCISGRTSYGGKAGAMYSSATPSTSASRMSASLTPISISCWPTSPLSICPAACWSTRRTMMTQRREA